MYPMALPSRQITSFSLLAGFCEEFSEPVGQFARFPDQLGDVRAKRHRLDRPLAMAPGTVARPRRSATTRAVHPAYGPA